MDKWIFKKGAEVEACFDEPGFRSAWLTATVLRPPRGDKKIYLEFRTFLDDDDEEGDESDLDLEEEKKTTTVVFNVRRLRPAPPREFHRNFKMSEEVDAFHNDCWWEGVITKVHPGGNNNDDRFSVYLGDSKEEELVFYAYNLRLHREWVDGTWVPPLEEEEEEEIDKNNVWRPEGSDILKTKGPSKKYSSQSKVKFKKGTQVEISSDEEGYVDAWFVVTYVKKVENNYLVEHKHFMTDDGIELLKEEVDSLHIRPLPPKILMFDHFKRLEEVDAWYNDAWWVGTISKVLDNSKYIVYFRNSKEFLEFDQSDLRLHQDWINGQWIRASQAL